MLGNTNFNLTPNRAKKLFNLEQTACSILCMSVVNIAYSAIRV